MRGGSFCFPPPIGVKLVLPFPDFLIYAGHGDDQGLRTTHDIWNLLLQRSKSGVMLCY